jgi:hypothetical protein
VEESADGRRNFAIRMGLRREIIFGTGVLNGADPAAMFTFLNVFMGSAGHGFRNSLAGLDLTLPVGVFSSEYTEMIHPQRRQGLKAALEGGRRAVEKP